MKQSIPPIVRAILQFSSIPCCLYLVGKFLEWIKLNPYGRDRMSPDSVIGQVAVSRSGPTLFPMTGVLPNVGFFSSVAILSYVGALIVRKR